MGEECAIIPGPSKKFIEMDSKDKSSLVLKKIHISHKELVTRTHEEHLAAWQ